MKRLIYIAIILFAITTSCSKELTSPSVATLVSPSNDSACLDGTDLNNGNSEVSFEWTCDNAETYSIYVENLNSGEVFKIENTPDKTVKFSLAQGEAFSWYVVSHQNYYKKTSETFKFYLAGKGDSNYAPFPSSILEPKEGASINLISGATTLKWSTSDVDGDNLSYEIYISETKSEVENKSVTAKTSNSNSLSVDLSSGKTYYWMVVASDGKNSSESAVASFMTN